MASGRGMAILSGLLHGLGNIGAVETERRERERAAEEKKQDRQAKLISLPHAKLPGMFQSAFTPDAAGNVQMPINVLPLVRLWGKEEEEKREDEAAWGEIAAARAGQRAGQGPVADPYIGITSAEQLATHPGYQALPQEAQIRVFNDLNRAGRFSDLSRPEIPLPAPSEDVRREMAGIPWDRWLESDEAQAIHASASAAGATNETIGDALWDAYQISPNTMRSNPLFGPGPVATSQTPSRSPSAAPQSDAGLVLDILSRRRRIKPETYLEQRAKLEAGQRPKFSPHLVEDVEGQRIVPFTTEGPGAGTVGMAQRVGGPKPREPRAATEYDKKMDAVKTAMLALHRMDPKTHPAPGTADWDVKIGDLAARMGIPLEGSVAGLVSGRTIAGTAPKDVPVSAPTAASIEAPLGTTRGQAASAQRVPMTAEQQNKQAAMRGAGAILDKLQADVTAIFADDPSSVVGRLANIPRASWRVFLQGDPVASTYHAQRKVLAFNLARASGSVGATTDEDARRVDAALPIVWPIPDSPAVAAKKMRDLPALLKQIADRAAGRPSTQGPSVAPGGPIVMPQPPAGTLADRNLVIEKDGQQFLLPKGTRMPPGATVIEAVK